MSPGRLLIGATPLGQPAGSARLIGALARADSSLPKTPGGSGPWPRRSR